MRAVIQRVTRASVTVDGEIVGQIDDGICVLIGAVSGDSRKDADFIIRKIQTIRIFHDDEGRMNRSLQDTGGGVLVISQFTLAADTTSGTRPSFSNALAPSEAEPLIAYVVDQLRDEGIDVGTGIFGARMDVDLCNAGPVTIILDSQNKIRK